MGITPADLTRFSGVLRAAQANWTNLNQNDLYDAMSNETDEQLPELLTAIYGSAADTDRNGTVDYADFHKLACNENQSDSYFGGYLGGNANNVTDSDLESLAAKVDAKANVVPPPPPTPKPVGPKPYKAKDCATTNDPYAKSTASERSTWEKTQAEAVKSVGATDMNQYILASVQASSKVLEVEKGMTLSLIAKAFLSNQSIVPGHKEYKAKLKELTDALVHANNCDTKIVVGQTIDLATIPEFAPYI